MANSDKHNSLFCACAMAIYSEFTLNHKKEYNSDIKRDRLMEFRPIICRERSGSVVECLTRDRRAEVRASPASLRCGP